jgi:negative regulator of flagellin synthesis FlgM
MGAMALYLRYQRKFCKFFLASPIKSRIGKKVRWRNPWIVPDDACNRVFLAGPLKKTIVFRQSGQYYTHKTATKGVTIMKINGTDLQSVLHVYQSNQTQAADHSQASTEIVVQQDRLDLSQQGQVIADAQRVIKAVPDVRESLVEKIRNEVENGTYTVDQQKTAEGILRESMVNQAAMA